MGTIIYPDLSYGIQTLKLGKGQWLPMYSVLWDGFSGLNELKTETIFLARPAYSQLSLPALFQPAQASGDHLSFIALFSDWGNKAKTKAVVVYCYLIPFYGGNNSAAGWAEGFCKL